MARPRRTPTSRSTGDYRHDAARRKNNTPVGMASYEAKTAEQPRTYYGYDPHFSPQLIWAGKPGLRSTEVEDAAGLEVDAVSLHIHERVSTQAIVHAVQRPQALQLDLFADPRQPLLDEALAELNRSAGEAWQAWEAPAEGKEGWGKETRDIHQRYLDLRRRKQQEIDRIIAEDAPQETLYDQPQIDNKIVRVAGPFTVDAILPADDAGNSLLLPRIERFRPRGSTEEVLFRTTRPVRATRKSHISHVVLDTATWEASTAFHLETSPLVAAYARTDHMGFAIPYTYAGAGHNFFPDFLVRLANGATLVLEVKGYEDEQDRAKYAAARRWCEAVSNWGQMGRWVFDHCGGPGSVKAVLARHTL